MRQGHDVTLFASGDSRTSAIHIDLLHAPLVPDIADRTLTTLHGRLHLPNLAPFYGAFRELPLASISNDQQRYLRNVNWFGTIYHGLPRDLLQFQPNPGSYFAFLGRIAPEKRPDLAAAAPGFRCERTFSKWH